MSVILGKSLEPFDLKTDIFKKKLKGSALGDQQNLHFQWVTRRSLSLKCRLAV